MDYEGLHNRIQNRAETQKFLNLVRAIMFIFTTIVIWGLLVYDYLTIGWTWDMPLIFFGGILLQAIQIGMVGTK